MTDEMPSQYLSSFLNSGDNPRNLDIHGIYNEGNCDGVEFIFYLVGDQLFESMSIARGIRLIAFRKEGAIDGHFYSVGNHLFLLATLIDGQFTLYYDDRSDTDVRRIKKLSN